MLPQKSPLKMALVGFEPLRGGDWLLEYGSSHAGKSSPPGGPPMPHSHQHHHHYHHNHHQHHHPSKSSPLAPCHIFVSILSSPHNWTLPLGRFVFLFDDKSKPLGLTRLSAVVAPKMSKNENIQFLLINLSKGRFRWVLCKRSKLWKTQFQMNIYWKQSTTKEEWKRGFGFSPQKNRPEYKSWCRALLQDDSAVP